MKRFKNILLVADFEANQQMAVDRAVSLARENKARLTVIAVVKEPPADVRVAMTVMPLQELLEKIIADRVEKIDALAAEIDQQGVEVKSLVVVGTPFLEIIRQVLRDKHDLLILSVEGKGGLKERLFGSTSMHLMRKCPCPVWVVKPENSTKYKRILAAVDTTNDVPDPERQSLNPLIMQLASSLAQKDDSELYVVQVWSVFAEGYMETRGGLNKQSVRDWRKLIKQEYTTQLDRLLSGINLKGVIVHRHLPRDDDFSKAIIKTTKSQKIDLLVMGTVCRTGIAGFFIGNTAEKILSEVNCSVLTVKPEGFVTPVTLDDK